MFKRSLPRPTFMLVLVTTPYQELILLFVSFIFCMTFFSNNAWSACSVKSLRNAVTIMTTQIPFRDEFPGRSLYRWTP
ncbi:hypothetical protein V1477_010623 [Vespula maculifrons]|uniref:Secreted protein n=1 Tax=Vespula maculifrons TaxID=7453 RepID=A0ABD2C2K9_VESMC